MAKLIITEEQSKELAKILKEEVYQAPGPQGVGMKKANAPYSINPEKVKIVRKFLDKNFKKGNFADIGPNGMPRDTKIVAMVSSNGDILKNMYLEQLYDLLEDQFQNMFSDHNERGLFMKQVVKDWMNNKIGPFGGLSVNCLK